MGQIWQLVQKVHISYNVPFDVKEGSKYIIENIQCIHFTTESGFLKFSRLQSRCETREESCDMRKLNPYATPKQRNFVYYNSSYFTLLIFSQCGNNNL